MAESLISVAEVDLILEEAVPRLSRERIPLADASGRILAESVRADRDLPPFDRVMMDGIALASDVADSKRRIKIAAFQAAGEPAVSVSSNSCVEIMTGAPLPDGLDCVIPYEEVTIEDGYATIHEGIEVEWGQHVHWQASDHSAGGELLPIGTMMGTPQVSVAASCGYAYLLVSKRPRVALVATGDELVPVGEPIESHQIRQSNVHALAAGMILQGLDAPGIFHFPDDPEMIRRGMEKLIDEYDLVVISGGSSKGRKDYMADTVVSLGADKLFHGVAQRPGKPFWYARHGDKAIFGLPGNPVSTMVAYRRFVAPAILHMEGAPRTPEQWVLLADAFEFRPSLTLFLPAAVESRRDGVLAAVPWPTSNSGDFAALIQTTGFLELPSEDLSEFPTGFVARYYRWE